MKQPAHDALADDEQEDGQGAERGRILLAIKIRPEASMDRSSAGPAARPENMPDTRRGSGRGGAAS